MVSLIKSSYGVFLYTDNDNMRERPELFSHFSVYSKETVILHKAMHFM